MAWHHLYLIPWPLLLPKRITAASEAVAGELGARIKLSSPDADSIEVWFVVPMRELERREWVGFGDEVRSEDLEDAVALTVTAVFRRRAPRGSGTGGMGCQLTVTADAGSNALCDRTAMHIAQRLAQVVGGVVPDRS